MAMEDGVNLLEQLGEKLMLLDAKDFAGLADLHTDFQTFAAWAEGELDFPEPKLVADAALLEIVHVILEEAEEPGEKIKLLGDMLIYLQRCLHDGCPQAPPKSWGIVSALPSETGGAPQAALTHGIETTACGCEVIVEDPDLLRDFYQEAREHLTEADVQMLTLETEPENEDAIAAVFRAFHTVKGAAGFLQMKTVLALSHTAESLLDRVRHGDLRMEGEVVNLCFESIDGLRRLVEEHEEATRTGEPTPPANWVQDLVARIDAALATNKPPQKLGEILVESGLADREDVAQGLAVQAASSGTARLGEVLVTAGAISAEHAAEALRRQQKQRRIVTQVRDAIKVDADRLDQLVDLIGERVIAEAMVRQSPEVTSNPMSPIVRRLNHMGKITRDLQEISMSLRMVPLRGAFQKMARLARDLAKNTGKQVEFTTQGDDTELDKNVVDQVADPLMHMIRNAIDHGIESPEERLAAGKPEHGTLTLRAFHEGGGVYIEVEEDGRGLNREAILSKAMERGLISGPEGMSDTEVWKLIFHPGLSTAGQVTDLSGRGVGMDVVQRNISALHGQMDIRSWKGKGTKFSMRLPLTLAIIDGMALASGRERYIVPIGSVVRAIRPRTEDLHTVSGRGEVLSMQDRLIPMFRLNRLICVDAAVEDPKKGIVLILEENGRQIGLLADELLGQQQVVIKPLGSGLKRVPGIAGGAIMPDGQVGLILDATGLLKGENALGTELEAEFSARN